MIDSRKIEDLHPKVQVLCRQFIEKCKEADINVIITSTYRDAAKQAALYAIGRTIPGKKVTYARAGFSFHNWKVAFDFCPVDEKGKCLWDETLLFIKCGRIGKSLGLEWGGDFKRPDMPHFQYTNGLTIADFLARKSI